MWLTGWAYQTVAVYQGEYIMEAYYSDVNGKRSVEASDCYGTSSTSAYYIENGYMNVKYKIEN